MKTKTTQLLIEDWEYRRAFMTAFNRACSICDETIETGQSFYFFGDKQMACDDCRDSIIEELENE